MSSPIPSERNLSKFDIKRGYAFSRSTSSGLATSAPATGAITCGTNEVALVDEITINAVTNDAATNHTVNLLVNGITVPIHFVGIADLTRTERFVWRPRGNLVVHPGQTLKATGVGAFLDHATVRFRKKNLTAAIRDGDIKGGGRLPNIASTNTVTGSGTSAGTAKQIIPPVSGMSVEILSLVFTGHNYNSAADNIRLGFWDGTTGNFGANGSTIMRVHRQGANPRYAQPIIIGNTDGCIQGPSGSGVYIQATTNLAGSTPTGDWVVVYRYIPANRMEVLSATGTLGATPSARGKFWCFTEAAVSASLADAQIDPWFAATTGNNCLVKAKGFALSTISDSATPAVAPTMLGFGLGAGPTTSVVAHAGLGEIVPSYSNNAGTPADVSNTVAHDDTLLVTNLSSRPGFFAYQFAGTDIVSRAHLVWGRFEADTLQAQDASGRSQYGFFL